MTSLVRCRAAMSEIRRLFCAQMSSAVDWREWAWLGEPILAVASTNGVRHTRTLQWGLSADLLAVDVPRGKLGTIHARDLVAGGRLHSPARLERCLIIVEAFAYPAGVKGHRTRSWIGLADTPLAAWAGVHMDGKCAGLLEPANVLVQPFSAFMPRLLATDAQAKWLAGAGPLSLSTSYRVTDYYHENLGESWSTGAS